MVDNTVWPIILLQIFIGRNGGYIYQNTFIVQILILIDGYCKEVNTFLILIGGDCEEVTKYSKLCYY